MAYSDTLYKAIEESGLSLNEIAKRCTEHGISITYSYISQLRAGKIPPPSNEISEALAAVCGIDKNKLVLEAYLDKAPKVIMDFIYKVRYFDKLKYKTVFSSGLPLDQKDIESRIELFKSLIDEEPLSNYIIEYLKKADEFYIRAEVNNLEDFLSYGEPEAFIEMKDDSMEPIIPFKCNVALSNNPNYTSGDIIAYSLKADNGVSIRKCLINDESITLIPINNEYEIHTYNKKDMLVLGKVKSIISDI